MIIIVTGTTHTGKTRYAQKLMEKLHIPYISQDHIKMGLIRSGYTSLSPDSSDADMTAFLWPVTREIIKTAVENKQNLIVEGCYIPFTWKTDFDEEYLKEIKFICLCFSERYITEHYQEIMKYEGIIENRIDDGYCTQDLLKRENERFRQGCMNNGLPFVLIDDDYEQTVESICFL
ncbi:MAG: adenylate kinase [Treponema sp.]|nr:adenylate kinase [Candidatus Treponema caballi]